MTNRERVTHALRFEPVDRVPYQIDFTQNMRAAMQAYTGQADFDRDIDQAIASEYLIKPEVEVGPELFRDEFGVIWNKSGVDKDIGVIDNILLPDPDALDSFELPPVDEPYIRGRMEALMARRGDRFTIAAIGFSLFERAWTLCGMENLLCDMALEPDFVHALMERIVERNLRIIDIALEYDIDCFHFGDDWGQQKGLIMGPTHWREFIKPYLKRMYDRVHAHGKFVSQHSCGDIRPVMDDLDELGLDMYQTFQPEIYGLDYAKVLRGRIAIWGGISTQTQLPFLTPEGVGDAVRALIDAFEGTGLVAAPTHAVPGDVPPRNILALIDALKEYGVR